ncbi:hypothetical protein J4210_02415 [Candidatus Woesearchaeota archaeon]|nr:hypothetical protein [Candidatus Woesearchaeota archaeon]
MNKKGAVVLHWILFGIIAAIGLFLYYSNTSDLPVQAPLGSWQLEMINSFLYKSELDLLDLDLSARETGWKVVSELAGRGGFLEQSSCGMEKGVNRWNIVDKWCLPDEKENLKTLFFQLFPNPEGRGFSPLAIAGQRIMSSGGMKTLKSTDHYLRQYTYDYSFNVNLHYSFDEYAQLAAEARKMVDTCRGEEALEAVAECLKLVKPEHWHYTSCDVPVVPQETRIWPFCVKSPNNVEIEGKVVEYNLALDFTGYSDPV